jgi:beta-phosphoglucomutase
MHYDAIIFDYDGTIVDTESYHYHAVDHLIKHHYAVALDLETFFLTYCGLDDRAVLKLILKSLGKTFTEDDIDRLMREKKSYFAELVRSSKIKTFPGMLPLIRLASQQRIPLAIATNSSRDDFDITFEQVNNGRLAQRIKTTVTADDVTHKKPHPEPYLSAAKKLHINPERCLVFEDSLSGIHSAKAAGMHVIALTTSHPKEELHEADQVITDASNINLSELLEKGIPHGQPS